MNRDLSPAEYRILTAVLHIFRGGGMQTMIELSELSLPAGYFAERHDEDSYRLYFKKDNEQEARLVGVISGAKYGAPAIVKYWIELQAWKAEAERWRTQATILMEQKDVLQRGGKLSEPK